MGGCFSSSSIEETPTGSEQSQSRQNDGPNNGTIRRDTGKSDNGRLQRESTGIGNGLSNRKDTHTGKTGSATALSNESDSGRQNDDGQGESSEAKKNVKIVLLGSGESGKSTILKQMKIINQNGYSQDERLMYKTTVYKNILDCAKAIINAAKKFELSLCDEIEITVTDEAASDHDNSVLENFHEAKSEDSLSKSSSAVGKTKKIRLLTEEELSVVTSAIIPPDPDTVLDPELGRIIANLWKHPATKKMWTERRAEFYIMDSAPYFFDNIDRIKDTDYIPTVNDILRARIKTTGVYMAEFPMGGMNIQMFDVGGQRSERKKWIHAFDNVTLIIFCVSLSEYDQVLLEEKSQNRLAESLVLFDSIINSSWFERTSVVLFLNKIDVFTEKLPHSPLENYFPDYTGGNDINKAAKYILWRFTKCNRRGLNIYPHLTQATDTSNIRLVFAAIKETILQNALKDSGIFLQF